VTGNQGFWKAILPMAAGGLLLIGLVLGFRPLAETGAVAYAQSNLRATADAAERVSETEGTLEIATALRLRNEAGLDDLLLIDPDVSSNDSEIVSVYGTAAARADTGACFWIRIEASGTRSLGTGTDCSAEDASEAPSSDWGAG
jgi:hypothetical protein